MMANVMDSIMKVLEARAEDVFLVEDSVSPVPNSKRGKLILRKKTNFTESFQFKDIKS